MTVPRDLSVPDEELVLVVREDEDGLRLDRFLARRLPWRSRTSLRQLLDEGRVRFLGFRRDVPAVLAACDVLVLPSRYEGFPNTLLEGMALGLPVAASRADGIPELVIAGETGLLHSVDDVPCFVVDVGRLLADNDLRARLGAASRQRAKAAFAHDRIMDQVEDCLCTW